MSYAFELRQEAILELTNSVIWYEEQQSGLGIKFRGEVNNKLELICKNPFHYKKSYKNFHEALTYKFPFLLVYYINEKELKVVVLAIFHTSRNPKKKFRK
jgi:ParE toxin of type II toxin-antitoxin system, parDE